MRYFPICEFLSILFIAMKLCKVISWSWWWVCSPFILAVGVGFIVSVIAIAIGISQGKTKEEIMQNLNRFRNT